MRQFFFIFFITPQQTSTKFLFFLFLCQKLSEQCCQHLLKQSSDHYRKHNFTRKICSCDHRSCADIAHPGSIHHGKPPYCDPFGRYTPQTSRVHIRKQPGQGLPVQPSPSALFISRIYGATLEELDVTTNISASFEKGASFPGHVSITFPSVI